MIFMPPNINPDLWELDIKRPWTDGEFDEYYKHPLYNRLFAYRPGDRQVLCIAKERVYTTYREKMCWGEWRDVAHGSGSFWEFDLGNWVPFVPHKTKKSGGLIYLFKRTQIGKSEEKQILNKFLTGYDHKRASKFSMGVYK